jgi:hypothetical protein
MQLNLKKLKYLQNYTSVALFASAYLYYSNPTTSSTTNYLPISEIQQKHHYKVWMTEKEVYADFAYNANKRKRGWH